MLVFIYNEYCEVLYGMNEKTWNDRFDKAISNLVRDNLTIVEGSFPNPVQRDAVKHLIKRAIYNSMDSLREDLINDFEFPSKQV